MALETRIDALRNRHAALSTQIEEATRQPGLDGLDIAEMKKQKLALKQEIERLAR